MAQTTYRYASSFNPNPVAGRTYIQSNDNYGTGLVPGCFFEASYSQIAEYNYNFHQTGDTARHLVNTHLYRGVALIPFTVFDRKAHLQLTERAYVDDAGTGMSMFLYRFHQALGSTKEIPPRGQSHTYTAGENKTSVVGERGAVFFVTGDYSIKSKLLSESQSLPLDIAVTLDYRQPQSSNRFNTDGYGLGVFNSYRPNAFFSSFFNLYYGHQNLRGSHFNAHELKVHQDSYNIYTGVLYDPYSLGGFYVTTGFRYSTPRIQFKDNPSSAIYSTILHASFNYYSEQERLLYFFEFNEDVLNTLSALEPDIMFTAGIGIQ